MQPDKIHRCCIDEVLYHYKCGELDEGDFLLMGMTDEQFEDRIELIFLLWEKSKRIKKRTAELNGESVE